MSAKHVDADHPRTLEEAYFNYETMTPPPYHHRRRSWQRWLDGFEGGEPVIGYSRE